MMNEDSMVEKIVSEIKGEQMKLKKELRQNDLIGGSKNLKLHLEQVIVESKVPPELMKEVVKLRDKTMDYVRAVATDQDFAGSIPDFYSSH